MRTLIEVRPGEQIPLGGIVKTGESYVNQTPITGESIPVEKQLGEEIYAGSVNGDGLLEIEVTKTRTLNPRTYGEAYRRSPIETFRQLTMGGTIRADLCSRNDGLSLLVMIAVPLLYDGTWSSGVYQGLVLLVIACPCALVIFTPISIVSGMSTDAGNGILIQGGKYLEYPAQLKAYAFDKTGTLTEGRVTV